jgi:hypothetical protein
VSNNVQFGVPVSGNPNMTLNPPIPTQIGLLSNLQFLNLDLSNVQGTIPTQVHTSSPLYRLGSTHAVSILSCCCIDMFLWLSIACIFFAHPCGTLLVVRLRAFTSCMRVL